MPVMLWQWVICRLWARYNICTYIGMNKKFEIAYFLKNAPLAILTSSLPGFINYAAILFLASFYTMEDVGEFRLIISYFALLGLFSLKESNKVMVRAQALQDSKTVSSLFFARLYTTVIAAMLIAAVWIGQKAFALTIVPDSLLYVAILSILAYPCELFLSYLQAEKRFIAMAIASFLKYAVAGLALVVAMSSGQGIILSSLIMVMIMALFNAVFCAVFIGKDIIGNMPKVWQPSRVIRQKSTHESFTLSLANWLPGTLEHVDKIIIGALFGMEVLGLYALCFSTGRFIYNALKPAFYIYYRHFVETLPPKKMLWAVMAVFTIFGAMLSALFYFAGLYVPFLEKFSGGETIVYILFLSYGVAMTDAVYTQSYGINAQSRSHHLLIANTVISIVCLFMFAGCTVLSAGAALILCAMHYPVRHLGTILLLSYIKNRSPAVR